MIDNTTTLQKLDTTKLRHIQQLLSDSGYTIAIDGFFGNQTASVWGKFKKDNWLEAPHLIGKSSYKLLLTKANNNKFEYIYPPINDKYIVKCPNNWTPRQLTDTDYQKLADQYNIPLPNLRAVIEVESRGNGFLNDNRPVILFEGHIFFNLTPKPVSKTRPDLSFTTWTRQHYKGGIAEWGRLLDAMTFDPEPALMSSSWGIGQIMGFNHKTAGYDSIIDFVIDAHKDEYHQANQMMNFISNHHYKGLMGAIRQQKWELFAYHYNGKGFKKNQYDLKLKMAFKRFSKNNRK